VTAQSAAAFYCVTGRDFFCGAVALLNSLRLAGHDEPLFVCDAGMDAKQRTLIEPHVTVVDAPGDAPPSMLKTIAPLAHPAPVMALLDADVIVTRSLGEQLEAASGGALAAFRNDRDRWFDEWSEVLGLGEMTRGHYLTSSALFMDRATAEDLLPLVADRQERIDLERTWAGSGSEAEPLYFLDQDVINAVARSRLEPGRIVEYEARLAPIPPFAGVRLADPEALRCRYGDGAEPFLLHHASRKPWLVRMRSNVYSRLLTRALLGEDVTLRLDAERLPLRLRDGAAAGAARLATDVGVGVPAFARRKLFPRRIRAWRDSP
jgi:hypothetical protein